MFSNNLVRRFFMPDPTSQGASPEDIQNQKKLNDELEKTRDLAFDIRNAYGALSGESEKLFNASITGQKNLDKETKKYYNGIAKEVTRNLKGQRYETDEIKKLIEKQSSGTLRLKDVNSALEKAKQRQQSIEDNIKEAIIEGVISEEKIANLRDEANTQYEKQKKLLKELTKEAERQEKALGITYKIFDGISKIPILNSLVKVEKVKEAMEDAAGEGKKTWSVFTTGVSATFQQIGKSLTDPLTIVTSIVGIFGFLIKAALEVDKHMTSMAKNLGISKDGALQLQKNFEAIKYQGDSFNKNLVTGLFTIHNQTEAIEHLNESLGTAGRFTAKQRADHIVLTKQMGLEVETAAKLEQLAGLQSKSAEKITNEIGDQVVRFRQETGIALNFRKIMTEVTKVSGVLSANLGNDPKRIAAAVMQAQKLGVSLEQSRKISESLLDFESSIQNELEAELLTGKQLNFERARALALQGKTTEAASELLGQLGGLSEFQKLNIIQQKAIAKSVGMTADEMADSYKQAELLKGTAFATKAAFEEEAKIAAKEGRLQEFIAGVRNAANGEQLAAQAAQIGKAETFAATMESIKETITKIASGPMLTMLERFAEFISKGENLKSLFGTIRDIIAVIASVGLAKMVYGLTTTLLLTRRQAAASATDAAAKAAGSAASIPIYGFGIAAAAAGSLFLILRGMMNDAVNVQDAAISPSGGLLISGPKGSFITDPSDQIVAAPNAASMLGGGGGITKADLNAIANRPISLNVQANTDTILNLNTVQSQYGASNSFA